MQPLLAKGVETSLRVRGVPDADLSAWALDDDRDISLQQATELLAPDEKARVDRFRFDLHRNRFIRGRGYLRRTLGKALGIPAHAVALAVGKNGKPALAAGGLWFNLSHSGGVAVLILSQHGEVGIDVELLVRTVDIAALSETCFLPEEIRALNAVSGPLRQSRFFAFWTAKEARMKLTGDGMSLAPKSIRLGLLDGLPINCLTPETPRIRFHYTDLAGAGTMCCYAVTEDHPCRA